MGRFYFGILLSLAFASCIREIDAPRCSTLADCPPGKGYTSCEDGYCFKSNSCDTAAPKAGDRCCPKLEVDLSPDSDCLALDIPFEGEVARPAADFSGNIFVTTAVVRPDKGKLIYVSKVGPQGAILGPVQVGKGEEALPPLLMEDLYCASDEAILRYSADDLSEKDIVPVQGAVAGLAGNGQVVGWPIRDGRFVLYDASRRRTPPYLVLALPEVLKDPELSRDTFYPPVVSGDGRRFFVATRGGRIIALQVASNPWGPTAYAKVGVNFSAPPVESYGGVYLVGEDQKLYAFREDPLTKTITEKWSTELGGVALGPLLVDEDGTIVIAMESGKVLKVKDREQSFEVTMVADFGDPLAPGFSPLLTSRPRIVAFSPRPRLVSMVLSPDGKATRGLSFDLPAMPKDGPILASGRLIIPLASGHVVAWFLPEELKMAGYPCAGGNAQNQRMVVRSQKK